MSQTPTTQDQRRISGVIACVCLYTACAIITSTGALIPLNAALRAAPDDHLGLTAVCAAIYTVALWLGRTSGAFLLASATYYMVGLFGPTVTLCQGTVTRLADRLAKALVAAPLPAMRSASDDAPYVDFEIISEPRTLTYGPRGSYSRCRALPPRNQFAR